MNELANSTVYQMYRSSYGSGSSSPLITTLKLSSPRAPLVLSARTAEDLLLSLNKMSLISDAPLTRHRPRQASSAVGVVRRSVSAPVVVLGGWSSPWRQGALGGWWPFTLPTFWLVAQPAVQFGHRGHAEHRAFFCHSHERGRVGLPVEGTAMPLAGWWRSPARPGWCLPVDALTGALALPVPWRSAWRCQVVPSSSSATRPWMPALPSRPRPPLPIARSRLDIPVSAPVVRIAAVPGITTSRLLAATLIPPLGPRIDLRTHAETASLPPAIVPPSRSLNTGRSPPVGPRTAFSSGARRPACLAAPSCSYVVQPRKMQSGSNRWSASLSGDGCPAAD